MLKRDQEALESTFSAPESDEEGTADRLLDLIELTESGADQASNGEAKPIIPQRITGVVVGRLLEVSPVPIVAWAGAPEGVVARSMVDIEVTHLGREVALMFEQQKSDRPLIMGLIEIFPTKKPRRGAPRKATTGVSLEVSTDKERVTFEAQDELVLRCGKASITLTKSGKILISGAYVSSSSTGMNRIRGGSVEIN